MKTNRKPASVNVDFTITGAVSGRGGIAFETSRDGVTERRVTLRLIEALHGGPVKLRPRGRTTLRGGWCLPPAGFGAGYVLWTAEVPELAEDAADLAGLFEAAERLAPGEVARITVHVRPDGERLPLENKSTDPA